MTSSKASSAAKTTQIAHESGDDYGQIVEVLSAFLDQSDQRVERTARNFMNFKYSNSALAFIVHTGMRRYISAAIAAIALALPFAGCVGGKGAASSAGKMMREGPHTRIAEEVKGVNRVHSAHCWRARGDRMSDQLLGRQSDDTGPC